jgi:hypothetical protein
MAYLVQDREPDLIKVVQPSGDQSDVQLGTVTAA